MKASNYKLWIVDNVRLRRVPEFETENEGYRCHGCVAWPANDKLNLSYCRHLQTTTNCACHSGPSRDPGIFVRDDQFQEYVVELVRRRVS